MQAARQRLNSADDPFCQTVKLTNLSVKKLHSYPIRKVQTVEDLYNGISQRLGNKDLADVLIVKPQERAPVKTSALEHLSVRLLEPSSAEQGIVRMPDFVLPANYIKKRVEAEEPYEVDDEDVEFVKQLSGINEGDLVKLFYAWEVESVQSGEFIPIPFEQASCLGRTIPEESMRKIHTYWVHRVNANERRPLCRSVWAYQEQLQRSLIPADASKTRNTRQAKR